MTPRTYGILVADDEKDVRDVLHDRLRQAGFSVWLAADGCLAVQMQLNEKERT